MLDASTSEGRNAAAVAIVTTATPSARRGTSRSQTSPGPRSRRLAHPPDPHVDGSSRAPLSDAQRQDGGRTVGDHERPGRRRRSRARCLPSRHARRRQRACPTGRPRRGARACHTPPGSPGSTSDSARCSTVRAMRRVTADPQRRRASRECDFTRRRPWRAVDQGAGHQHRLGPSKRDAHSPGDAETRGEGQPIAAGRQIGPRPARRGVLCDTSRRIGDGRGREQVAHPADAGRWGPHAEGIRIARTRGDGDQPVASVPRGAIRKRPPEARAEGGHNR